MTLWFSAQAEVLAQLEKNKIREVVLESPLRCNEQKADQFWTTDFPLLAYLAESSSKPKQSKDSASKTKASNPQQLVMVHLADLGDGQVKKFRLKQDVQFI